MSPEVQLTELERVLLAFEDTVEYRRKVLTTLMRSKVYMVLDKPWDQGQAPPVGAQFLIVSDGEDKEHPMLALFTDAAKVAAVPVENSGFQYPVEVAAGWALLGVPPGTGIRINPNSAPGFRILADLAAQLRTLAERSLPARAPQQNMAP